MRRHKKGNFWCCTTTQTVNPEYFDGTFAVHRLSAPQHSFYSPVCGITMRDERIRGLKIHEETQEEAKIKGKNLKTIILLTAPGRLVDAQIQTHKKIYMWAMKRFSQKKCCTSSGRAIFNQHAGKNLPRWMCKAQALRMKVTFELPV